MSSKPNSSAVEIEIPFHDVDAMKIVWHGHYYKYFEIARTALLRSIDYDVTQMLDSQFAWPVIESHCRYIAPLLYGMKIKVTAQLIEFKHRLKIEYQIRELPTEKIMSKGHTTQVAYDMVKKELCLVSPPILFTKLGLFNKNF